MFRIMFLSSIFIITRCGHSSRLMLNSNAPRADANFVEGRWISPCLYNTKPDPQGERVDKSTRRSVVVFTGTGVTTTTKGYNRAACEKHAFTVEAASDYVLIDDPKDPNRKRIDYTVGSIKLTYHLNSSVDELNDIEFCGFKNWKVNEAKEISGKKCFDDLPSLPAKSDTILDLVLKENEKLYFGRSIGKDNLRNTNDSPQERPTSVIKDEYLEREPNP